jgi:hypothetical protein
VTGITPGGWFSIDNRARYRFEGDGLDGFVYLDPDEKSRLPTFFHPADYPEMAAEGKGASRDPA